MIIFNKANQRRAFGHGNFKVQVTFPGININSASDLGLINLGRIDHAHLKPGAFIAMHKHQNDEILSLLKSGTMLHKDSDGNVVPITKNHLMMMNAGTGFFHEESIPMSDYKEDVLMLQIFIRPEVANEKPLVQFAYIADGSQNEWRLIAAPQSTKAALNIRSAIWVYDIVVENTLLNLPPAPFEQTTYLLYIFSGTVKGGPAIWMSEGDSLILQDEPDYESKKYTFLNFY